MYNKDFDSLNAGAPDIRLSGNQQMASAPSGGAELYQVYQNALQSGQIPQGTTFEEFKFLLQQSQAPQQNSGIMAAGPGTYTQNRKQMMAYGGVAGADGRKRYGLGSLFQKAKDKFVDDIIPNEIKENPLLTAALVGGGINQFGIPDFVPGVGGMGQNWLGDLLGAAIPGDAAIDTVFGKEGVGYTLPELIQGMPGQGTGIAGMDDAGLNRNWAAKLAADVASGTLSAENLPDSLKGIVAQQINKQIPGLNLQTPDQAQAGFDYKKLAIPLSIGAGVGKYVSGLPKDTLPADATSMDLASIRDPAQESQAAAKAAGLYFTPEDETRLPSAQGGRIGYAGGGGHFESYKDYLEQLPNNDKILELYAAGDMAAVIKELKRRGIDTDDQYAQGGRIGYGKGGDIMKGIAAGLSPELSLDTWKSWKKLKDDGYEMSFSDYLDGEMFSQGGRVPAQEGGLMDLGGMEKDYRQEGGFVPIGGREKADDVPARLSKNEFVFTADAVRNAGGGDVDAGAEVMENLMEHLEAGGTVSEDSQGLEGAREMFANAQQLEKRII